jgi:hypothetical protein
MLSVEKDQVQFSMVNIKAHIEEKYKLAGFSEEKIRKLMDTKSDATDELLSEAKKGIELILKGQDGGVNFSATTGWLKYVSDWILDNSDDISDEVKAKLEAWFDQHVPIAMKNAEQKQFTEELIAMSKPKETVDPNAKKSAPSATPTLPASVPPATI